MAKQALTPHQLITHCDWHPDGTLEIRYDYPFSTPHELREQVLRFAADEIPTGVHSDLKALRSTLRARHTVAAIRVPHGEVVPTVRDGILTVVTRDQRRTLPVARLYCYEIAEALGTNVERNIRMEAADFSKTEIEMWRRLRQWVNGRAWADFQAKIGDVSAPK